MKQHRAFWRAMSGELFSNVKELFTQIDCWVQEREPGDGTGAQLAVSNETRLFPYLWMPLTLNADCHLLDLLCLQLRLDGRISVQVSEL